MAKQTFTTGQVLTAAQMTDLQQTAMTGGAASTKTVSYVLVAADAGTRVAMNAAGSTTITVNTGLFSAGDTVSIQNIGAGVCTVTAGTATVNTSGSLVLTQYQGGILYFTSASAAIFFQFATPASGDIEGVTAGTGISGGGTSGTVTITNSMATAIDAKGDLVAGTGADAFSRLAVGTNGTALVAASGEATGLKWGTPNFIGCALAKTSQQTLTTFAYTAITFTQEDIDTNGFHDNSTNTSRITIPSGYAGKYQFGCHAVTNNGGNSHTMSISKNGANQMTLNGWSNPATGNGSYAATMILDLAVADYVEFRIYTQATTVVDSTAQNDRPTIFYCEYLGA